MKAFRFPPGVLFACLLCGLVFQSTAAERRTLDAAAGSPEELARRFLAAVADDNVEDVRRLAINEEEFKTIVYPELPAADPRRNTSAEFVWNTLHIRSESILHSTMSAVGGRHLTFDRIFFTGETTDYETYEVHRESMMVLLDEEGAEQRVRLFGSVLEMDGQFKIFSFNNR